MSLAEYFTPLSEIEFPKIRDLKTRFRPQADVNNTGALPSLKPLIPPPQWTVELMPFRDSYATCYVSHAEDARAVAGLVPGMSSYPFDWQTDIENLNAQGITVVSLGLLQTQSYASYYPINRELVKTFFMDENLSPLYRKVDPDLDREAIVHSTACPILIDSLSEHGAIQNAPDTLSGVTYLNPFMDTYDSSEYYHPYKNAVYWAFMSANADKGIGTTGLERWWMGEKDTDHMPSIYDRPENARVKKTRAHIRALNREIWTGQRANTSRLPQTMYLGDKDFCVCADTAISIADKMGIDVKEFEGDHFTLMRSPVIFEDITTRMFNRAPVAPLPKIDTPSVPESVDAALERFDYNPYHPQMPQGL